MNNAPWTPEEEAAFRVAADGPPRPAPRTEGGLALLSVVELAELPPPEWLLDSMIPAGGFSVLYGPSGAGKSFVALDWSLCVATGLAWYGQETRQGWVLYVAAEGVAGLYRRIDAWMHARNRHAPDAIRFLAVAVNMLEGADVGRLEVAIATMPQPPALIVVDTMARSMTGGDENSARDVGLFIAAVDRLRNASGGAALAVHHTGKDGEGERGSSSLRGAADAMFALKTDGANLRLECTKQKDAEPFDPWRLHLQATRESCVIALGTRSGAITASEREMLESVSAAFGTQWATGTALQQSFTGARASYFRTRKSLIDRGYLETEDDSRTPRCRLTSDGLAQAVSSSLIESTETGPASLTPVPPIGTGETGLAPGTQNGRAVLLDDLGTGAIP